MSKRRVRNYLRPHRRVWGFTQEEIARLLGFSNASDVSRFEHCKRKRGPTLETALACQVLFGIQPSEMFPAIHREVEERVIQAAYRMHQGMSHITTLPALRKREFLELAFRRATGRAKSLFEV